MIYGKFKGAAYNHAQDGVRLTEQLQAIYTLMSDGVWRTVDEIAGLTKLPNTRSIEAQLRNLRKVEFGGRGYGARVNDRGHMVLRRNRGEVRGLSEYRLMVYKENHVIETETARPGSLLDAYDAEMAKREGQTASQNAKDGQRAPEGLQYEREPGMEG